MTEIIMEDQESKIEKDRLFSGLNRCIGDINELVEDFERNSLGKTSFIGGFKFCMEKMQIFIQKQRDEYKDMEVLSGILNDEKANNEKRFGLILDSQTTIKGNQVKMAGKFMDIDKKVEKTRNEVLKSVQEIHGEMKKNHNDMMKSFQETRDQLDRNRLEIDNAMNFRKAIEDLG